MNRTHSTLLLKYLAACLWLCASAGAHALTIAAPPAKPAIAVESPPPPRMVVRDAQIPLRLDAVAVTTSIVGRLAQTSVALTFSNPNARVLEGELQFPLAEGQEITGMAMDFNGVMREAVPVEKARGQAVFEDVTRARIDPALAEKTVGNNFKLRVYPIPAGGRKTVVLRYEESLVQRGAEWVYRLPLAYGERVGRFAWNGSIATARAPRVLRTAAGDPQFTRTAAGFDLALTGQDVRLAGFTEIAVTAQGAPLAVTQDFDGATFFHAEPAIAGLAVLRKAPARVAIAWDASGSGAERDHAREFALLAGYFNRFAEVEVALTVFRDRVEAPQRFRVTRGDWSALRRTLERLAYDGATNFAALNGLGGADELLLFSDGMANYGAAGLPQPAMPTYTVAAARKADVPYLRALAERTGGHHVEGSDSSVEAAIRALVSTLPRVSIDSGEGVADVLLASPYPANGRVLLAGRLTEVSGRVVLRVQSPGAPAARVVVPVMRSKGAAGFAAQRWARLKVAAFEPEQDLNRGEIERLGKRFRLITAATSLIILDTAADYARNDIEPPADLRAEYQRLRAAGVAAREADRRAHLERVVAQFRDKQAWWEREFPKGAKPLPSIAQPQREISGQADVQMQRRQRLEAPATAPMPAPAPAPAMRAAPPEAAHRAEMQAGNSMAKMADVSPRGPATLGIRLQPWAPDSAYARRLREADAKDLYRIYLDERESHRDSTAFFLDVADLLFAKGETELATRVLSNLAEMNLENRHILRVLGYRLLQAGDAMAALPVFRRVRDLSPDEPQSHRDLGLAHAQAGQAQKAVDALYEVVSRPWHGRFPEVELIALAELNAVLATATPRPDVSRIDPRLLRNLPVDLRAVLTWDADNTDIDLWVTDPNGEKAFYGNRLTYQGGRMSADFTGGYGPEEFSLKAAKPGKYRIEAQFFGERRQIVTGATTLQVRLTTRFGSAAAKEQLVTLRLAGGRDTVLVGEFEVGTD